MIFFFFGGGGGGGEGGGRKGSQVGVQVKERLYWGVRAIILLSDTLYYPYKIAVNFHQDIPYGYSSIQKKCQGGNKYALPITVKFG